MEQTNSEWADRQLHGLSGAGDSPDIARAWARLRERRRSAQRRRVRLATAVLAGIAIAAALPAPRAIARPCVEACLAGPARLGAFVLFKLAPANVSAR